MLHGEVMFGIGANLGSSLIVEMIGSAGFEWTWIDCEHETGGYSELIPQMQAAGIGNAPPVCGLHGMKSLALRGYEV